MVKQSVKPKSIQRKFAQQRRQELIQAGITCIGRGGMKSFTIDQMCKQAGVSRGLINHHFKTKDELLRCIYSKMTGYLVEEVATDDPKQQLVQLIESSFDGHSSNRSNLQTWLSIWGEVSTNQALKNLHQSRYSQYKARIANALTNIAQREQIEINADNIARQLIALIDGLWLEHCLHSSAVPLEAAKSDCYQFLQNFGVSINTDQYLLSNRGLFFGS